MLQDFQEITLQSVNLPQVVGSLLVAFVCGFTISLVYRWTYRGASYAPTFVRSMIFLAMITAVVMLVIGNNLARAFGLVGAMSIIRFRTAVKDPQDIVFIFFALATGLAAGVGMHMTAIVSTLVISLIIILVSKSNYAVLHKQSFLLTLSYADEHNDDASYLPILRTYCKRHKLINIRSVDHGEGLDLTYYVDLRKSSERAALTKALVALPNVSNVNMYYDTEQT